MDYDRLGKRGPEVIRSDRNFEHFSQRSPWECCEKSYFASFSDLWNVYGECENFAVLKGHTGAVMELHFSLDGR